MENCKKEVKGTDISMQEVKLDAIMVLEEGIQAAGGFCGLGCSGGSTCGLGC